MKDKAKKLLEERGLFHSVAEKWNDVEFVEKPAQTSKVHACYLLPNKVFLYPSLKTLPNDEAIYEVLKAFGCLLAKDFDEKQTQRWEMRLVLPEDEHIGTFQDRLRNLPNNPIPPPTEANQYSEYLYIVKLSKNPVERLVHIHLSNALIVNNVSPRDASSSVDVRKWPSTEGFANRTKYFSLLPLTGAYCHQMDCFGQAFASYAFGFEDVYHTALRPALIALVKDLL